MIVEIGHLALVIALCLAVVQGVVPIAGAARLYLEGTLTQ